MMSYMRQSFMMSLMMWQTQDGKVMVDGKDMVANFTSHQIIFIIKTMYEISFDSLTDKVIMEGAKPLYRC